MTAEEGARPASDAAEAEFRRLFWQARKAHTRRGKRSAASDPEEQAALAFAEAQSWAWAKALLEASRLTFTGEAGRALELLAALESSLPDTWRAVVNFMRGAAIGQNGQHEEAIQAFRKALEDLRFDRPGYAWNNLGFALASKGLVDEAIQAYRKALEDPNYDTPGWTWNNLGAALAGKGQHDEAIQAYRKALEDPNYDTPGHAWHNLGLALHNNGQYDEAIQAYRKALEDPNDDTPGLAWNNLGVALADKGQLDEAIDSYRKALEDPNYNSPAKTWTNLAFCYAEAGKKDHAEEAFEKALASDDPDGRDHSRARLGLQQLKAEMEPAALSPDDRSISGRTVASGSTEEIETGLVAAIQAAGETQYDKYIDKLNSKREDTLSILRGWSSAVTLLEGSERRWRGGGYFFKWRGYGIALDPGFDFLRNFHDAGYHGREIHAVLVSHNHPDHNSDLKHIDDLRYELYKRLAGAEGSDFQPYVLLWDQDSSITTKFASEKPKHQFDPVVLASGFPQSINLLHHQAKIPLCVTPFKVQHGDDVRHAMGMVVALLDDEGKPALRIGYTADTAYFQDLHKHLADCDLLIAHISQPSIEELQDASKLKDVHLGYRGTLRLLRECQPKLALIGEFWAGFTDLRIPLVKALRQRSGVEAVLPAGLKMHLRLPSLEIECTECRKPTPFAQVKIAPPTDNFGSLAYLCLGCMLG